MKSKRSTSSSFSRWIGRLLGSRARERKRIAAVLLGLPLTPVPPSVRQDKNFESSRVVSSLDAAVVEVERILCELHEAVDTLHARGTTLYFSWGLTYTHLYHTGEHQWEFVSVYTEP